MAYKFSKAKSLMQRRHDIGQRIIVTFIRHHPLKVLFCRAHIAQDKCGYLSPRPLPYPYPILRIIFSPIILQGFLSKTISTLMFSIYLLPLEMRESYFVIERTFSISNITFSSFSPLSKIPTEWNIWYKDSAKLGIFPPLIIETSAS